MGSITPGGTTPLSTVLANPAASPFSWKNSVPSLRFQP
jgi:hypothetical protein